MKKNAVTRGRIKRETARMRFSQSAAATAATFLLVACLALVVVKKTTAAKIIQVTLQNFLNAFFRTFYTICIIFPLNTTNITIEQYFLNI